MSETQRLWNTELQRWVYPAETEAALNAALLTIDNYYNGDRVYAERWLLAAYDVNQKYGNG